jgi:hypothetical protein
MQNIDKTGKVNSVAYIYATHFIISIPLIAYMLHILVLFINGVSAL